MKIILLATILTLSLPEIIHAQSTNLVGTWQGELSPGVKLKLVFKFHSEPDGTVAGTMDNPDQGTKDIPATATSGADGTASFNVPSLGAFEGKFDATRTRIAGTWKQGAVNLPLTLEKTDAAKASKPAARKANPESIEVNKKTGGKLAGTWEGTMQGRGNLRLVFRITASSDGGLLGVMDIPDQKTLDVPVAEIRFEESKLVLDAKSIGGWFEGQFNNSELTGVWRQLGQAVPVTLRKKP